MPKGFTGVYILIILVVVVLGGLYYFGKLPVKLPTSQPQLSASPTQSQKANETSNPDLIEDNWRRYTNSKYGFSLKYPQDWYLYTGAAWDNDPNDSFSHVDLSPQSPPSEVGVGGVPQGVRIFIDDPNGNPTYYFNKENLEVLDFAKRQSTDPISVHYETINGIQVVKSNGVASAGKINSAVFIPKGKAIIQIFSESLDEKIFNQILSTFRFD